MTKKNDQRDIAVIGMSCRLPGASSYQEFWQNLIDKKQHTGGIPSDREFDTIYNKEELKGVSLDSLKWGGFVDDIHRFDTNLFDISANEASQMDPMQKSLLEATYSCFEDAGYAPDQIKGSSTGVFLGITNLDFKEVKENNKIKNNVFTSLGSAMCFLPGRLSYEFGFKGPSLALDTACSSSGVAIHYAIQALLNEECSSAICGGANYIGTPTRHIESARLGLLSKKGKCASFDQSADGYVRAEGVGLILLKKLSNAIEDNDHIYGVIKGSGVNHSGKGKSIIAPNIFAQSQLMKETLERSGVEPETVGYVEAQAIGNPDTDTMEFMALKRTFDTKKAALVKEKSCFVGTYKPNTGHVEAFSGTISIIKSMLSFKHEILPPVAGLKILNSKIERASNYMKVVKEATAFRKTGKQELPRRIAINNFGLSNTNCCFVLEEFDQTLQSKLQSEESNKPYPFLISAQSIDSLFQQCKALLISLNKEKTDLHLINWAGTLMFGRDHQKYRVGIVASTIAELKLGIESYISNTSADLFFSGEVCNSLESKDENEIAEQINSKFKSADYSWLLGKWVNGYLVDWTKILQKGQWKKIPLPGYIFQGNSILYHEPSKQKEFKDVELLNVQSDFGETIQVYTSVYKESKNKTETILSGPLYVFVNSQEQEAEYRSKLGTNYFPVFVTAGTGFGILSSDKIELDFNNQEHYAKLISNIERYDTLNFILCPQYPNDSVNQLDSIENSGIDQIIFPIFCLCKELSKLRKTRSAIVIPYTEEEDNFVYMEALSGFSRALSHETSSLRIQPLRLNTSKDNISKITSVLANLFNDDNFISGGAFFQEAYNNKKLQAVQLPSISSASWLKKNGTYLIAGGFGEISQMLIEYILKNEEVNIVLVGRSILGDEQKAKINLLRTTYLQKIEYFSVDITVRDNVELLAVALKSEYGQINGIFNTAGVCEDKLISHKSWEDFKKVLSPKIEGTNNLWELLSPITTDFFTLFSSISSVLGNIGQTDYSLANAYQNAFAKLQSENPANTLKVNSICWPYWEKGGMQVSESVLHYMKKEFNFIPLGKEKAFTFLNAAMLSDLNEIVFFEGDKNLIDEVLVQKGYCEQKVNNVSEVRSNVEIPNIIKKLKQIFAGLMGVSIDSLDEHESIENYGINSMLMMGLMNEIESEFNTSVDVSIFTNSLSISGLSVELMKDRQLMKRIELSNLSSDSLKIKDQKILKDSNDPKEESHLIAVIGMAGRFPKSDNVDQLWENLSQGKDLTELLPEDRTLINEYSSSSKVGIHNQKYIGGFVNNVADFDSGFFNINDEETMVMDFNQRVILEETQHLLDNSGYDSSEIRGKNVGVFIAGEKTGFSKENIDDFDSKEVKHYVVGQISNMISARISHQFDLKGPSILINTACSGSLVAIHQACDSIRSGDSEMAIAGGVFVSLHPNIQRSFKEAGVISPKGKMRVFDQDADGIVLGEAASLVLLKNYNQALKDGDNILGIIRGSAVNNDGHTMGVTTPNLQAQKDVIRSVINKSGVNPENIGYYEAHGTGTLLGDPIEIKAATDVFREYTSSSQYCAVGSVKSNLGHSLSASGLTGFVKVLQMLSHKKLIPTINCDNPHDRFRFKDSPFYPNTGLKDWESNGNARLAAISSFGFGGTNGHLIVEEFIPTMEWIKNRVPKPLTIFSRRRFIPKVMSTEQKVKIVLEDLNEKVITAEEAKRRIYAYIKD